MPITPTPPDPRAEATTVQDPALLRTFLLGLAEGMTASAESTDRIRADVVEIARAYGWKDVDVVVLPTIALVQTGSGETARVSLRSVQATFRFDQIAELGRLLREARAAAITPGEGIRRLNEIGAMPASRHWFLRTLGHALLTAGLALLLAPSWQAALVGFGLGALIGVAKLVRSQTLSHGSVFVAANVAALRASISASCGTYERAPISSSWTRASVIHAPRWAIMSFTLQSGSR